MAPAPVVPSPRAWVARCLQRLRTRRPVPSAPAASADTGDGATATDCIAHATPELPLGTLGGYRLHQTLQRAERGALHLGLDPATGLPVALKTVQLLGSDASRERFLRESHIAARLVHPHIVRTLAAGIEGEGLEACGWIAMEWVSGGDLARYTAPGRLLPELLVLKLGAAAAEALAYAHGQGVVHRDLKPANLLFHPGTATVKITDFGCARLSDAERSRSGLIAGTPAYMAPEQLSGLPVDGRCDLYALGVVLFELLTGRLPFPQASMGQLLTAIATEPAPPLAEFRPDLPPAWGECIARLLAKPPAQRPADCMQLAKTLRALAADGTAQALAGLHA